MLNLIRKILSGSRDDFTFYRYNPSDPVALRDGTGLYIHIPFCKNSCPYCPYIKIGYRSDLAGEYKDALKKEITRYFERFGHREFSSLYIGGGTPTLMTHELGEILNHLNKYFTVRGDIALETSPDEITPSLLQDLRSLGVNMLSLGVQSFKNSCLRQIGRKYDGFKAEGALRGLVSAGFDAVNVDLIFAIRGQTLDDIRKDLTTLINHQVQQITCYPLFTFPFTEIGTVRKLRRVQLPCFRVRKKMYYAISEFLEERGFSRTNVWSFAKQPARNYSSVTRDYFLGLGVSSGSYNGSTFYFNTFSVPEYTKSVDRDLPVSIKMDVSSRLERLIFLYWQLYATTISKNGYRNRFEGDVEKDFGLILRLIRLMHFIGYEDDTILRLNTRGAHWIHLLQNYFALDYVSRIWSVSKHNPWPKRITISN